MLICAALLTYHTQPFVLVRDNQLQLTTWLFLSLVLSVVTVSDNNDGDSNDGNSSVEDNLNSTGTSNLEDSSSLDIKGVLMSVLIIVGAFGYVVHNVVTRFFEQGSIKTAEALPRPEHGIQADSTETFTAELPKRPKHTDVIWKSLNEGAAKPTIGGLLKWFACRQPVGCQTDFVHIISEVPASIYLWFSLYTLPLITLQYDPLTVQSEQIEQQQGQDASDSLDRNGLTAILEAMVTQQWNEQTHEGEENDGQFFVCAGTGASDWHRPRPDEWLASLYRLPFAFVQLVVTVGLAGVL